MNNAIVIAATLIHGNTDFVPAVLGHRQAVSLDIGIEARKRVPADASLVIRVREIFGGGEVRCTRPLSENITAGERKTLSLDISQKDLPLSPGCWLLLVDIESDGKSLAWPDVGCALVYAKAAGESALHARASYNLSLLEFAWDSDFSVHYTTYHASLPATGDPCDEANRERFRREFVTREDTSPELQHDGGLGLLYAAHVFHALGETDHAAFCDKALRRTAGVITDLMLDDKGRVWAIKSCKDGRKPAFAVLQQECFALKILCQIYFYFRFGPNPDQAYARSLLDVARAVFDFQVKEPLIPGCGMMGFTKPGHTDSWACTPEGCKVYDGRILSGLAWYCLAYRAEHGQYPPEDGTEPARLDRVLNCGEVFARQVLGDKGWYDAGCLLEEAGHIYCGNMNVLLGLLPTRRILRELGRDTHPVETGIREAFRFLTQTSSAITGEPMCRPLVSGMWAVCAICEICQEYLREFGDDKCVQLYEEQFVLRTSLLPVTCYHRSNTSGAALLHCDEYRALATKPALPWNAANTGGRTL